MVTVHRLPEGDPFAIVIGPNAHARTSVSADGSAVTIILREAGKMPCSIIFPHSVAAQIFGADFATLAEAGLSEPDGDSRSDGGDL